MKPASPRARPHVPERTERWALALLAAAVIGVYGGVVGHEFVAFDDPGYVSENPFVLRGLTAEDIRWAFTAGEMGNWNPLTWLSYMLEVELFGVHAGVHLATNVALHLANTLLLFFALRRLTAAPWPSLATAALFALHPLHVESVAWVSERKDVLSTFFWFAALWAYARYAERGSPRWYGATLAAFALGLMAKPMLVTVPFALLLIDLWPLRRVERRPIPSASTRTRTLDARLVIGLLREKIPFFVLSIAASVVTVAAQHRVGAMSDWEQLPLGMRVANAAVSYWRYLGKTLWPANLAVYYPYDVTLDAWRAVLAALGLAVVSVLALRVLRRCPYVAFGWFWYLGTLVPVIGLVQVGGQALADRYTYVPLVGIFVAAAWGVGDLATHGRLPPRAAVAALLAAASACAVAARAQVGRWKDSRTLLSHAIAVTESNHVAHNNLGVVLSDAGNEEAALEHFAEALRINPHYAEAHINLGAALSDKHRSGDAIEQFRIALRFRPQSVAAHMNLGLLLADNGSHDEATEHLTTALRLAPHSAQAHSAACAGLRRMGRIDEAIDHCRRAQELRADMVDPRINLGAMLAERGRREEALAQLSSAVRLAPESSDAHNNLGLVLAQMGRLGEALAHLRTAVRLDPDNADAHSNLGNALKTAGRTAEAVAEYEQALRSNPGHAEAHNNLGIVLRETGRWEEAAAHFAEAVQIRPSYLTARNSLAAALVNLGRLEEALEHYRRILADQPQDAVTIYNLATVLARVGRPSEAIDHLQHVVRLTPEDPQAWGNLAFACAEAGRDAEAVAAAYKALDLARAGGHGEVAAAMEQWLAGSGLDTARAAN